MRLLTAIIPFFTAVLTEKICNSIVALGTNNATTIKIVITIITGLMLIIIEILGAGVIAESVNQRIFYRNGKPKPADSTYDYDDKDSEVVSSKSDKNNESSNFTYNPIKKSTAFDKALSEINVNTVEPAAVEVVEETAVKAPAVVEETVANEAIPEPVVNPENVAVSNPTEEIPETIVEDISEIEDLDSEEVAALEAIKSGKTESLEEDESFNALVSDAENLFEEDVPSIDDYDNIDKAAETPEQTEVVEAKAETEVEEDMDEENANPASIITQEEYAALISPEPEVEEVTEEPDELEWPDLPPVPETLPPEYIDENDPIFDFPPEEEFEESLPEIDLSSEITPEEENESEENKTDSVSEDNPYAATKFIDSVVHQNPAYPFGITIHNEEEVEEPVVEKKTVQPAAPKYPTKISLNEEVEEDLDDDYVEDVTLPEPDYFNMNEPTLGEPFTEELTDDYEYQEENSEKTLSEDFFDIDMNDQEDEDYIEEEPVPSVFEQIKAQEAAKPTFTSSVSDVFSDMEADVRKNVGISDEIAEEIEEEPEPIIIPAKPLVKTAVQSNSIIPPSDESPELNPNANTAKNLTADELTDFFNAQQAENIPVTREIQGNLPTTNRATIKGPYVIPSDLLTAYKDDQYWIIDDQTKQASINLKQTLAEFNIDAEIIGIKKGPVVTMFELLPAPGVKLSKIVALQDNIALSLAASSVRIVAPIPGKQAVGIEVPNKERSIVSFRELIEMDLPEYSKMAVPVILGKDILGKAQLIDLVKTPHMLIAGATGSGKSVCVNSLILSILYKRSHKDVKLILVDPKVVELKLYNNIPHLLTPVITEPKRALQALQYCLCEMERRYALLDGLGVRDISSYNARIKERNICTEKLPYIVVIIDEFADLMATSGKELESIVARLTAMSRAVGIHLVLATQRPSVNVITGLIKANIPSLIAFMVASRTDSNIIIDSVGAEKLLGRGDMLYASAVDPYPVRIQGTFVSDSEVESVVDYVKQFGEPEYIDEEIFVDDDDGGNDNVDLFGNAIDEDPLYDQALEIVVQAGKASASYIQRRLKIGYNRAARLVEEMEERGIVGPANGSKPREIIHIP